MRCPSCGLTNFADKTECRRCGTPLSHARAAFADTVAVPGDPFRGGAPAPPRAAVDAPAPPSGPTAHFAPGPIGSVHGRGPTSVALPFIGSVATVMGETVSMPAQGLAFPSVCSKCDATRDLLQRQERLVYTPWYIYLIGVLLLPLGLLPFILALALGQRSATVRVPVCTACSSRWTQAKIVRAIALLSPIGIGVLIGNLSGTGSASGSGLGSGLIAFLLSLAVLPALATFLVVRPAALRATHIEGARMTVAGFSQEMRDAIAHAPEPSALALQGPVATSSARTVIVILLLVLALPVLGIFAVVAIYGVRKYIVAAKTQEARAAVTTIAERAKKSYEVGGRLCPSASRPIPEQMTDITRGGYQSTATDWQRDADANAGFACLGVSLEGRQRFQYSYVASPTGFVVTARGDLDADGEYSTFELEGTIEVGGVQLSPMRESAPGE